MDISKALRVALLSMAVVGLTEAAKPAPTYAQAATDWQIEQPYIRFYEKSPWIRSKQTGKPRLTKSLRGDYSIGDRYDSDTALDKTITQTNTAQNLSLKTPGKASLSSALLVNEVQFAKLYVPEFEQLGVPEPQYGEIIVNKKGNDRRWVFYAHPGLDADTLAEQDGGKCKSPSNTTYSGVAVNPSTMFPLNDAVNSTLLRRTIAHELLHASQRCNQGEWLQEGVPEGYAAYVGWDKDLSEAVLKDAIKKSSDNENEFYHTRRYYLPLDLGTGQVWKWGQRLGVMQPGGKLIPGSNVCSGGAVGLKCSAGAALNKDTFNYEAYMTGSYFRYMLENDSTRPLAHGLLGAPANRAKYYELVKEQLRRKVPEHLAAFYTEYASYGGGRYVHFNGLTKESDKRQKWLQDTFLCMSSTEITLDGTKAKSKGSVTLEDVMSLSGRCFTVKWKDIDPATHLTVQLLTQTEKQAKALTLGHAYVDGAAQNGPPYPYCYQNVVGAKGGYGKARNSAKARGRAANSAVNKCLSKKSPVRKVKHNGKPYYAVTFATKFKPGKKPGEAVFIVTNAAEKYSDNEDFDVIALAQHPRVKIKWASTGNRHLDAGGAGEPDLWTIVGNSSDVYFNDATRTTRDIKIDGLDKSSMLADLAKMENKGAMTVVGGNDYMLQIVDSDEGVVAMIASLQGMQMALGHKDMDSGLFGDCNLKSDITVNQRDESGLDISYKAEIVDMQKLMSIMMSAGAEPDCNEVRKAIYDEVDIEAFFPDGEMHLYTSNIQNNYPEGYDEAIDEALTDFGVADLGGLPLRSDLQTFLQGMPGAVSPGGPNAGPPSAGDPGKSSSSGSGGGGSGSSGAICTSADVLDVIEQLQGVANPCECSCETVNALGGLSGIFMSPAASQGPCAEPLVSEFQSASERVNQCITETCAGNLPVCR